MQFLLEDGLHVAKNHLLQMVAANEAGELEKSIEALDAEGARNLWHCLRRFGWQSPEDADDFKSNIDWWLQSEDIEKATVLERLEDAIGCIDALQERVSWLPASLCEAFSEFRTWSAGPSIVSSALRDTERRIWGLDLGPLSTDDKLFKFFFDDEITSRIVTAAAGRLNQIDLAYSPSIVSELEGREADPRVFVWWARDKWKDALEGIVGKWRAGIFETEELVRGWEIGSWGEIRPVGSQIELREWLSDWLDFIHEVRARQTAGDEPATYLEDIQRELRNTRQALRKWKLPVPLCLNDDPQNIDEAERRLEHLIDGLGQAEKTQHDESSDSTGADLSDHLRSCASVLRQHAWIEGQDCPFGEPESTCFSDVARVSFGHCLDAVHSAEKWLQSNGTKNDNASVSITLSAARKLISGLHHFQSCLSAQIASEAKVNGVVTDVLWRWDAPVDGKKQPCAWVKEGQIEELRRLAVILPSEPDDSLSAEREEILRGHVDDWRQRIEEYDVPLPDVAIIKATVVLFYETFYSTNHKSTPIFVLTVATTVHKKAINLICRWMRKAWPENPSITSSFNDTVTAIRDGELSAAEQIAERLAAGSRSSSLNTVEGLESTPTAIELLNRLKELHQLAGNGLQKSVAKLIREKLLNSNPDSASFICQVINKVGETKTGVLFSDSLPAVLRLSGRQAPRLFGKHGLFPDLSDHEQWQKSVDVLGSVVGKLEKLTVLITDRPEKQPAITNARTESADGDGKDFASPQDQKPTLYSFGPLVGNQKQLLLTINPKQTRFHRSELLNHHMGNYYIVKIKTQSLELYCKHAAMFEALKKRGPATLNSETNDKE